MPLFPYTTYHTRSSPAHQRDGKKITSRLLTPALVLTGVMLDFRCTVVRAILRRAYLFVFQFGINPRRLSLLEVL